MYGVVWWSGVVEYGMVECMFVMVTFRRLGGV